MFKLLIAFALLYIIFVQGRQICLEIFKFFRAWYKKKHPDITITRHPPRPKKRNKPKGEYTDYEEIK